jgi:hypothetical protein
VIVRASPAARNPVRFVLNAHGPNFFEHSMLCIKSIRATCGPEAPIRVYQPDNLPPVPEHVREFFARNEVEVETFHNEFLPTKLDDPRTVPARHLTTNKVYCMQHMAAGERRLFVDADIVFLRDPRSCIDLLEDAVACPQVDTPAAFGGDWAQLYQAMNVDFPARRTIVWERYAYGNEPEPSKVQMIPYFSSGVVYSDWRSAVPMAWLDMCSALESRIDLVPRSFFMDQIALTLAVHKTREAWTFLPKSMNCTFEVWRYTPDVQLLHYIGFDTLAAAIARFPEVSAACRPLVQGLAREDGLDLRFRLLTQWPRWWRRSVCIASDACERYFGRPIVVRSERA